MLVKTPNETGWWNYYSCTRDVDTPLEDLRRPELLYVICHVVHNEEAAYVAYDEELEEVIGREVKNEENYWEGTDCTQEYMPGVWMKATEPTRNHGQADRAAGNEPPA